SPVIPPTTTRNALSPALRPPTSRPTRAPIRPEAACTVRSIDRRADRRLDAARRRQRGSTRGNPGETFMGANFGIGGLDWQQRVNWDRMRKYRLERARERMKAHGLGAILCMYD